MKFTEGRAYAMFAVGSILVGAGIFHLVFGEGQTPEGSEFRLKRFLRRQWYPLLIVVIAAATVGVIYVNRERPHQIDRAWREAANQRMIAAGRDDATPKDTRIK